VGVPANHDWLGPARDEPGHVRHDDRLTEDHAAEDVADRAVRGTPHLLQAELRDPRFVGGDGGALDAHTVLLDRVRRIDGHLIAGLIAILDRQVVVLQLHVEVRQDELVADLLPNDPGHLVAVELDDRVRYLDLGHRRGAPLTALAVRAY
jgi:hypothetical protein